MTERLLALLDVCADIESVRRIILQAAVRGLLVPQKHSDGSVAELLDDLRQDVQASGRVWSDPVPSDIGIDAGHSLPPSWTWVRLDNVVTFGPKNGYSPKPSVHPTRTKTLTLTATTSGHFDGRHFKYVDETIDNASSLWLRDGDILIQRSNTIAYVGAAAVYRGAPHEFIYPDLMMKVRASCAVSTDYIHLVLLAPPARSFLRARASGTAGSMPKVNQAAVLGIPIPLPPLAEQKRIVAKVDQLMVLCDELEARQAKEREVGDRLTKATFSALLSAENTPELRAAWGRISESATMMLDRPEHISELRGLALELAARGVLTSAETPSFPPAASIPFAIPEHWHWLPGREAFTFVTSGSRGWAKYYADEGPIFLRIGNLDYGSTSLDLRNIQRVNPPPDAEGTRTRVQPGDVLVSITGDTGMVGLVPADIGEAYINQHIALCRPREDLVPEYVAIILTAPSILGRIRAAQRGIKNSLGLDDIRNVLLPIPPVSEQHHIADLISRIMTLCDDLEARLRARDEKAARLAEALVAQILA